MKPNNKQSNESLIRTLCEEQLLQNVQTSLEYKEVSINMAQVNKDFMSILRRYHTEVPENTNYCKNFAGMALKT